MIMGGSINTFKFEITYPYSTTKFKAVLGGAMRLWNDVISPKDPRH